MGTTIENRISSTQAKDAIYKAHSISSSASEIDDTVTTTANFFNLVSSDSLVLAGYYNTLGVYNADGTTKGTNLMSLSGFSSLKVKAANYGQSATVLFAANKTTVVQSYLNSGVEFEINLASFPTAKYIAVSTGIGRDLYVIGEKIYNLHYIENQTKDNKMAIAENKANIALLTKRYPFADDVIPDSFLKDAILDIRIFGLPLATKTTVGYLRKNNASAITGIAIYIYNGSFGEAAVWAKANYTPSTSIELLKLIGTNFNAQVLIDWSKVSEGRDTTSIPYSRGGVSREAYAINLNDPAIGEKQCDILLPSNICLPSNKPLWLYDNSIIENSSLYKAKGLNLSLTVNTGSISRNNDVSIISASANQTLNIKVRDSQFLTTLKKSFTTIAEKSINVLIAPVPTAKTFNTLVIADSYFDSQWGDGMYTYLKSFATADGNTFNFKGTRTSYSNLGEAYSSWDENLFYTRYVPLAQREPVNGNSALSTMKSPFVFSTNDTVANSYFSFSEYLTTNSIGTIDNIIFFLGMNGGDGSKINSMITNIKLALPSVKIIIAMCPPEGLARQNVNVEDTQLSREIRNKAYLTLFDNRLAEKIYVAPTSASFSREFGLLGTNIPRVQYPTLITENSDTHLSNNHHPNSLGCKGLADTIYNTVLYANKD